MRIKRKKKKETEWGEEDPNLQEASIWEKKKKETKWGEMVPNLPQEVSKRTMDDKDE